MLKKKRYRYNPKTLAYELHQTSVKVLFSRGLILFVLTILTSFGYFWIYTNYLNLGTPKTLQLKRENADLLSKLDLMNSKMKIADQKLERLKQRDNNIYRPIFGEHEIPDEVRNAGFGGVDRYNHLKFSKNDEFLTKISERFDQLSKKTVIQSESLDRLGRLAEQTDAMATSVPRIPPVNIAESGFRLSSGFGYRRDPFEGDQRMHWGIDISGPIGSEIYATGDGVVIKCALELSGYGNHIVIDHGFGYKTCYAHLKYGGFAVREGQKVSRGEVIGYMGSTGRSKGPHVHYEVFYRNSRVNPTNYYSGDIGLDEYDMLIGTVKGQ